MSAPSSANVTQGSPGTTGRREQPKPLALASIEMFHPTGDRVLVLPAPPDAKFRGVHVPDQSKEKPQRGIVVAVGPGKQCDGCGGVHIIPRVRVGDTVYYGKYAGGEIQIENDTLLIMREEEIVGIVKQPVPKVQGELPLREM